VRGRVFFLSGVKKVVFRKLNSVDWSSGIGFNEPGFVGRPLSAFGGEPIIKSFPENGYHFSGSAFRTFLRLVLVDRVLPKVISEIKNGWLRIEQM